MIIQVQVASGPVKKTLPLKMMQSNSPKLKYKKKTFAWLPVLPAYLFGLFTSVEAVSVMITFFLFVLSFLSSFLVGEIRISACVCFCFSCSTNYGLLTVYIYITYINYLIQLFIPTEIEKCILPEYLFSSESLIPQ